VLVLDTHAWIWWAGAPRKLSAAARRAIDEAETIGVSAISCWEVATLVRRARLVLDRPASDWVALASVLPRLSVVPIDAKIAVAAGSLSESFHGDPADRLIVATALASKAALVTRDRSIRESRAVACIW
jgi:PIN domain nuclease of toxin-antitoxin system